MALCLCCWLHHSMPVWLIIQSIRRSSVEEQRPQKTRETSISVTEHNHNFGLAEFVALRASQVTP